LSKQDIIYGWTRNVAQQKVKLIILEDSIFPQVKCCWFLGKLGQCLSEIRLLSDTWKTSYLVQLFLWYGFLPVEAVNSRQHGPWYNQGKDKPMEGPQESVPQRLLLRIPEVAERLGIGRTKIYELIATGELPTVRFGRAVRVSATTLQKWVEEREQQGLSA
jgi:excisionase family DNA binding protein